VFEQQFLRFPFAILEKTTNKVHQCASIACLTKIVINCPDDVLYSKLEAITDKIIHVFRMKQFQATQQLLECIISIIFHIQDEFRFYNHKFLPILIEQIRKAKTDSTKRVAIDAIYSIGAHLNT